MRARPMSFPLLLSLSEIGMLTAFLALHVDASYRQKARAREVELRADIDELAANAVSLNHRLVSIERKLREVRSERDSLKGKLELSQSHLDEAEARLVRLEQSLDASNRRISALRTRNTELDSKLAIAQKELANCRERLAAYRLALKRLPPVARVVAGIKGQMERVVILFDCSGSMEQSGRWEQARDIAKAWAEHLDIGECALITFSTTADLFTIEGRYVFPLRGPNARSNRMLLLKHLESVQPSGGTNTLSALRLAYQLRFDGQEAQTIILFSDGAPNNGSGGTIDLSIAESIYGLCRQHRNVTVNTVGLGFYFEKDLATFLIQVARETDGAFLGR